MIDEINEIFQRAGTTPTVDASRAAGSEAMGDSARQESRTSESFSLVQEGNVGGSTNSSNMSPEDNSGAVSYTHLTLPTILLV